MGWQAVGLAATIFIRSYNNFGVPAPDLAAAREHAEAVLQRGRREHRVGRLLGRRPAAGLARPRGARNRSAATSC